MTAQRKIRVLVVDDSAIVRKILSEALALHADIEVVGTAPDAYVARDKILALQPDVLTLDIEMPKLDGVSFLRMIMKHRPMPVIIISSLGAASTQAAMNALREGAVEVLCKPGGPYSVGDLVNALPDKIRAAAHARVGRGTTAADAPAPSPAQQEQVRQAVTQARSRTLIAIGASTGGTEAIAAVLQTLPPNMPPILIVQHIPAVFSRAFAERLDKCCKVRVKEAADGDPVQPGHVLVAPGDFHMVLRKGGAGYAVTVKDGPRVCYQRPSVDVMFSSVAAVAGNAVVGVILTGMGADGAQGMLKMKQAGAYNIAQDEASCVVYGMPREAVKAGAVDKSMPLRHIGPALASLARH